MTPLQSHARFAALVDAGHDWAAEIEGIPPDKTHYVWGQPDWPVWATAFCSLAGTLADLDNDAPDTELLDLLKHGWYCFREGIVTPAQVNAEHREVLADLEQWGRGVEIRMMG